MQEDVPGTFDVLAQTQPQNRAPSAFWKLWFIEARQLLSSSMAFLENGVQEVIGE